MHLQNYFFLFITYKLNAFFCLIINRTASHVDFVLCYFLLLCAHSHPHPHTHTCTLTHHSHYSHSHVYTHACTCSCTHKCMYIYTCIYTCILTHAHTHKCTLTHTHTHTHTHTLTDIIYICLSTLSLSKDNFCYLLTHNTHILNLVCFLLFVSSSTSVFASVSSMYMFM